MSFVGSHTHSLDAKKRVFVPAKYRVDLGDEFYITRKIDNCLAIYTADDWDVYVDKISKLPDSKARKLKEFVLSFAQKCTPDASGRIIIDDALLKYADIKKNVVFAGNGQVINIWAEEAWVKRQSGFDPEEILSIMSEFEL